MKRTINICDELGNILSSEIVITREEQSRNMIGVALDKGLSALGFVYCDSCGVYIPFSESHTNGIDADRFCDNCNPNK